MIGLAMLLVSWSVRMFVLAFRLLFLACIWIFKGTAYLVSGTTKLILLTIASRGS
jgi:hypothetical protein